MLVLFTAKELVTGPVKLRHDELSYTDVSRFDKANALRVTNSFGYIVPVCVKLRPVLAVPWIGIALAGENWIWHVAVLSVPILVVVGVCTMKKL